MVGGDTMQRLVIQANEVQAEIWSLEDDQDEYDDHDYYSSGDRYEEEMTELERLLESVIAEIENLGGTWEPEQ